MGWDCYDYDDESWKHEETGWFCSCPECKPSRSKDSEEVVGVEPNSGELIYWNPNTERYHRKRTVVYRVFDNFSIDRETEKAILVTVSCRNDSRQFWVPKSIVEYGDSNNDTIKIPSWFKEAEEAYSSFKKSADAIDALMKAIAKCVGIGMSPEEIAGYIQKQEEPF